MTLDISRSPRSARLKILTGTMSALVGGALGIAALTFPSSASPMPAQDFDDEQGNVVTCEAAGLEGEDVSADVDFTISGGDDEILNIDPDSVPDGWVVTGVVVKGGPNYRVYYEIQADMTAPDNPGGNVPAISHWFICAEKDDDTPPPTTTTPPDDDNTTPPDDDNTTPPDDGNTTPPDDGNTTPPDDDELPEPSESPSTEAPETPKPSESTTTPPGDTLPDTGANTGLLGLGAVLLLGGAALAGRSAFLTR